MAERDTPKSMSGEEKQPILQTTYPVSSTPYVPTAEEAEANSVQSARTHDEDLDGELTPHLGETPGSRSGSTELGNTAVPVDTSKPRQKADQSVISGCDDNVNHRIADTPDSTASQGPHDERAHQEDSHDDRSHDRKSTRSRSPSNPLSPTDDESGTDATEYGEVEGGMDAADGLPDWHGEE